MAERAVRARHAAAQRVAWWTLVAALATLAVTLWLAFQ
jgi:hypothetical protein